MHLLIIIQMVNIFIKKKILLVDCLVNFQPGLSPGVPFPSFDTTPIIVFPQPQPQQPGQVGPGMDIKMVMIKIFFLFL
jgi:hypothetical protein